MTFRTLQNPEFSGGIQDHTPSEEECKQVFSMSLQEIQEQVNEWSKRNFPDNWENKHRPLLGVQEELGELSHCILKMEQGIRGTPEQHMAGAADAIGDILVYLMNLCGVHQIDLQSELAVTWARVRKRDWLKNKHTGGSN